MNKCKWEVWNYFFWKDETSELFIDSFDSLDEAQDFIKQVNCNHDFFFIKEYHCD